MAFFELNSDITIGDFRFSGVNEAYIKRSMFSIADRAIIKLPSICKIVSNGKASPDYLITGKQFNDGDAVIIKLGYNGDLNTEFQGFVSKRSLNMPLEIECEGYSWLLRRNTIKEFYSAVTVKELLNNAVSGIGGDHKISVLCNSDISLANVNIDDKSGFDVINNISAYTDGCLTSFFIQPDTLWCGMVYSPYANGDDVFDLGGVSYKLGLNVVKENKLKERSVADSPLQVKYSKRLANGDVISRASSVFENFERTHSKILNHLNDPNTLKQLANEKAYRLNYSGYEGSITAFLQPYVGPGYLAFISDDRYKEHDGTYLVEGTEVFFGLNGARRIVEMGPKAGSAKDE